MLNAVDDYYDLVRGISNDEIRDTATSFLPNVENYTVIMANHIASIMKSSVITAEYVMMAKEIIYDNLSISNKEAVSKAHAFIKSLEWSDYKPSVTHQMLSHGANRYYKTPSCPKLFSEGLCVGRCPYYDGKGT